MESESDDDINVKRYSNVQRLVKRFNDDRKSDNAELEGDESDKGGNDDDNDELTGNPKFEPIDDEEPTDDLNEEEVYASAEENDDFGYQKSKQPCDDEELEIKLREDNEKESVEDGDEENRFRRSFRTIRRSKTKRRKTSDTEPEDVSGEVEDGASLEDENGDGSTVRTAKTKIQQFDADGAAINDNLDEQEDGSKVIDGDNDNLSERENEIDGRKNELNDDIEEQDDDNEDGNEKINDNLDEQEDAIDESEKERQDDTRELEDEKSDDNDKLDDEPNDNLSETEDQTLDEANKLNTRSFCSQPIDVVSEKVEDDNIDSTQNLRDERQDTVSSNDGVQFFFEEFVENTTDNGIDSITRSFRPKFRFSSVGEREVDIGQEQGDASMEIHDNDDDSTAQEEFNLTYTDNFYSFTFNDPMEDLKALTGRIVKDAMVFQQPSNFMPPDTPPPESDKYYEDENELPEAVEPAEPTAEVSEEQEEPENLEAYLKPEGHSEFEEDMVAAVTPKEKLCDLRVNTNALCRAAQTYELERFEKNAMMIFHQESIPGYERRKGSRKDAADLISTFEKFGFEIQEHLDPTKDEIFRNLEEFAATDFSDFGCVAVAIMTHGSTRGCLRAKDRKYYETDIINYFKTHNNPTLVTKPKVIIIQACRGKKNTPAVPVNQPMTRGKIAKDHDDHEQYTLPTESDILVLHSTYAGNPSHRDETYGTWFIQTLCKKIKELAHELDLESIFTEVQREVAIDKEHKEWNIDTKKDEIGKQMPVKMSTLIRKLYLIDKDFAQHNPEVQAQIHRDMMAKAAIRRDSSISGIGSADNFKPCACFLDKFVYLRDCMRHFVEDNPDDEVAQRYLEIAESFEDVTEFNKPKEKISEAIVSYLKVNAEKCQFYKYLNL